MIRIIVVEDNSLVREGVIELLNDQDDMEVVGEAEGGVQTLELLDTAIQTDIVVTDLNMDGMDGLMLSEKISSAHPQIKVIILTMHLRTDFVERAFQAGAQGYVLKNGNINELYDGIRKVFSGEKYVTAGL
jgi:DNA-binding NarL/FixJ family response regulator